MRTTGLRWAVPLSVAVLLVIGGVTAVLFANRSTAVLTGVTLIDGSGRPPVEDAVIVVKGGRIVDAGPRSAARWPRGAAITDLSGKYAIPGLADMHNHLRSGLTADFEHQPRHLMRMLGYGITLVFVPGLAAELVPVLRHLSVDPAAPYSHFHTSGPIFRANAGAGPDYAPASSDDARRQVKELKALGVDAVKIVHDDMSWLMSEPLPVFSEDVLAAIIKEAHALGLKVYIHAPILHFAKQALRLGADGLLHGILSDHVDEEFVSLMQRNDAVYVTTLAMFESAADPGAWLERVRRADTAALSLIPDETYADRRKPENLTRYTEKWVRKDYVRERLPVARANVKRVLDAGIPIVAGTDTGIFGVARGISSHLELVLLVEAGLTAEQAIRAATINAARMVGRQDEIGTLAPGKRADIVIVDGNPLQDISNTARVHLVMKGGAIFFPHEVFEQAERLDVQ